MTPSTDAGDAGAGSAGAGDAGGGDGGRPYGSLVTIACDVDGAPILLLSRLSAHTRHLQADPRAALLVEDASRRHNPQTGPRVSLIGRIDPSGEARHRRRFLARHPSAAAYADFADFAFHRMTVERAHYVGGFARAHWIAADAFLSDPAAAAALAKAEASVLAHMNADHAVAVTLYATRLLGRRGRGWRLIGVDPDGADLAASGTPARLTFPHVVSDASTLRETLVALARSARGDPGTPAAS